MPLSKITNAGANLTAATPKATGGTYIIEQNGYRYHIFTTSDFFTVNTAVTADVLIVAGGGAGGNGYGDQDTGKGGGGAGGVAFRALYPVAAGSYPIVVGAGGAGRTPTANGAPPAPSNGANSSAFGITANGGGYGGGSDSYYAGPGAGGSGGGGGSRNGTTAYNQGAAATQPSYSGWTTYGNAGGSSQGNANYGGGGGGGAGGVGAQGGGSDQSSWGGQGGQGINFSSYFPPTVFNPGSNMGGLDVGWYGGGGGGGSYSVASCRSPAMGGWGGGGHGNTCRESNNGTISFNVLINGVPNTGGGGGGAAEDGQSAGGFAPMTASRSGNGGSGVVLIRFAL